MNRDGLIATVRRVSAAVAEEYLVVGAGGTSLSLQGIKEQTLDIDFIVERGNIPKLMETFEKAGITELEVSGPGFGFGTIMPSDYVERAVDCGTYGTITVKAMNLIDVVITKAGRYYQRDKEDMELCRRSGITLDAVLHRLRDYNIERDERGNVRKALTEVFGASPQDVDDAL